MTRWKLPVVAALLAVAAACDGAPTAPAAPADGARPTAPARSVHIGTTIHAPFRVTTPQAVTATATVPGSWRYVWEYRWCSIGTNPTDCNYQWRSVVDGQNITSVTKNVYQWDRWVDFRVTVLDSNGYAVAYDEHRVYGPSETVMEPVGPCGGSPCGWQ